MFDHVLNQRTWSYKKRFMFANEQLGVIVEVDIHI